MDDKYKKEIQTKKRHTQTPEVKEQEEAHANSHLSCSFSLVDPTFAVVLWETFVLSLMNSFFFFG